MPVLKLRRSAVLLIVDLQPEFAFLLGYSASRRVLFNARELCSAFERTRRPTFVARTIGLPPGKIENYLYKAAIGHPDRKDDWAISASNQIQKRTLSAFANTGLNGTLRDRGVTQIVIAGLMTSFGIASTARHAYDLGYHVILVSDAMADRGYNAHVGNVAGSFPLLGVVTTTVQTIKLLKTGKC